jgi:hypothetical protein
MDGGIERERVTEVVVGADEGAGIGREGTRSCVNDRLDGALTKGGSYQPPEGNHPV